MVDEDATWESLKDPGVLQGLEGRDSLFRVPFEALNDKVKEGLALISNDLLQGSGAWQAQAAIGVFNDVNRLVCAWSEELVFPLSVLENFQGRNTEDLHDQSQLLHFTFTREDGNARVELDQNTSKTPHVDPCSVRNANDDLGSSVEAGLNVRVDPLV